MVADNSLQDQQKRGRPRGRPFEKGCSAGRPYGLRNRATQMAEALLDGEAEAPTRKVVGHSPGRVSGKSIYPRGGG